MGYGLLLIGFLICAIASWNVNATFKRYQSVSNRRGMTAAEAARQILNENGLQFIQIERVSGSLTDHYDPRANVIRLSDSVYDSTSVAAIGVAAHECGHAVQHATSYAPLKMRSALVPVVSFASNIMTWVLLGGMLLIHQFPQLLLFGIILFASTTLPVEINASQRALVWLSSAGITNVSTHGMAEDALRSAAYTYVVAALGSLATLLYYIMIFLGGRSRD